MELRGKKFRSDQRSNFLNGPRMKSEIILYSLILNGLFYNVKGKGKFSRVL
jgi:hypothetical protein